MDRGSALGPAGEGGRALGSVAGALPTGANAVPAHESDSFCFQDKNTILQEMVTSEGQTRKSVHL